MADEAERQADTETVRQTKITVDYSPGRWGKTFHLFDLDGREIALTQKEAVRLAQAIIKIAKEK